MKRLKKIKKKLNNSGLTLIEVLIAMTLLTIAIVPMMRGFVQVGRYGEKGRNLQQATSIAQTAMENCKAYNVTDIAGKMGDETFFDPSADYMKDAQYKSDQDGLYFIDNMTVDGRKMSMSIELNPIMATSQEITKYENCNERLDGIFVASETLGTYEGADYNFWEIEQLCLNKFCKWIAEESPVANVESAVYAATGETVDVTADEVMENLFITNGPNKGKLTITRDITITAKTDASGFDTAEVEFEYHAYANGDYEYTMPDGTVVSVPISGSTYSSASVTATIYTNNSSKEKGGKLERVYFYYYPAYSQYVQVPFAEDNISIDTSEFKESNGDGKDLDVYLIKQKLPLTTDILIELAEAEPSYKNNLTIKTCVNGSQMGKVNLYHNFDTNIGNGGDLNWPETGECTVTAGDWVDKEGLVEQETKEMMYTIEVKMYTNSKVEKDDVTNKYTVTAGDEVLTLDGTKINW